MVPYDSNHLFACLANPTHLTSFSLWSDSTETARLLVLTLDGFDDNQSEPYHPYGSTNSPRLAFRNALALPHSENSICLFIIVFVYIILTGLFLFYL